MSLVHNTNTGKELLIKRVIEHYHDIWSASVFQSIIQKQIPYPIQVIVHRDPYLQMVIDYLQENWSYKKDGVYKHPWTSLDKWIKDYFNSLPTPTGTTWSSSQYSTSASWNLVQSGDLIVPLYAL